MSLSILIVDDEATLRDLFRMALETEGHQIAEADNGLHALSRMRERQFDLVIIDMLMPVMGGLPTIVEIKKHWPEVKILAISGSRDQKPESVLESASKAGADAALAKPIPLKTLLKMVGEICPQSSPIEADPKPC